MPLVNYHNHTTYCGHAEGTIDEYIEAALKAGITEMGFSDHAPISEEHRPGITMTPDQVESYIALVLDAKERWKGRIEIRLGFEVDFPLFDDFAPEYFSDQRIDYLIGSCHFIGDWPFDHPAFAYRYSERDIDDIYAEYYGILESLAASALFNIIGHFDLPKKFGHMPRRDFSGQVRKIASIMARNNTAIELNSSGLLKPVGAVYPSPSILKIMAEEGARVTLGSDSHSPSHVGYAFDRALAMIKEAGFTSLTGFDKRKIRSVKMP
jgi:histidinol-phosphatase (PHP family)